jgi:hypothetical protein
MYLLEIFKLTLLSVLQICNKDISGAFPLQLVFSDILIEKNARISKLKTY